MANRAYYNGVSPYGGAHQKAREAALALFHDGDICPLCRKPMRSWEKLSLDHAIPVVYGGADGPTRLAHASCQNRQGGKLRHRSTARRRFGTFKTPKRRVLPKW